MTRRPGRRVLAALLAIACSGGGKSQDPPVPAAAARTYELAGTYLFFADLAPTADGGFVASAYTSAWDAVVLRVAPSGAILWQQRFESGANDIAHSVRPVPGGYVVGGESWSGSSRSWAMKLDEAGAIVWKRDYAPMARTSLSGHRRVLVRPTPDGGYVLATADEHYASANYYPRAWVAKLDAAGAVTWQNAYGDLWLVDGAVQALEVASDGGYVLAGCDAGDLFVAKLASDGALLWKRNYGDVGGLPFAIHEFPGVGYVVAGRRSDDVSGLWQAVLLAVNTAGDLVWQRIYGNAGNAAAVDVAAGPDGGLLVVGRVDIASGTYLLGMKVDAAGDIVWQRAYGEPNDIGWYAGRLPDGRWRIAGFGGSGAANGVWVLELPADGAIAFPGGRLTTATSDLARISDALPETSRPISATATTYTSGSAAFTTSAAGLTVVQDAP